jgi:hypothetical protein
VKGENEALKRRVAELEVQLQQEHALASRSAGLQALLDLKAQADAADDGGGGDRRQRGPR